MDTKSLSLLRQLPQRLLLGALRGYRFVLSPWLGSQCRFEPTCSVYAIGAIERHGALAGSYLAARRVVRCHPWCDGGHDAVPETLARAFALGARARSSNRDAQRAQAEPTSPKIVP